MAYKRLLCPQRLRVVPAQFSWIDQRLVREGHISRLGAQAQGLYLFLSTVADAQGLSYYADRSIGRLLHLDPAALAAARSELLAAGLIAYEKPLYQVLSLDGALPARLPRAQPRRSSRPCRLGDLFPDI